MKLHSFGRSLLPLLAAGVLFLPGAATAQMAAGISAGLTSSTFEGDDAEGAESNTGFMAGGFVAIPLGEIISVVPGAYYVQKGAEFSDPDFPDDDFSVTLGYLEIPLLLSVAVVGDDRPFGVNLFAGPEIAFRLSCSEDFGDDSVDCQDDDDIKGTDFGLIAGAGVGFGRFFVNGGLDIGLTGIIDGDIEDGADLKNSVYFLQAGIMFPIGG